MQYLHYLKDYRHTGHHHKVHLDPALQNERKQQCKDKNVSKTNDLDDDHINLYEQFSKNVCDIISSSFPAINVHHDTTHISLCKLGNCDDSSKCLTISLTIRVYQDMTIAIWYTEYKTIETGSWLDFISYKM